MSYDPTPAEKLEGRTLAAGWSVLKKLNKAPDATGGCFSTSYRVERDGRSAFLKAMDIHGVLRANPERFMEVMANVSGSYNHEKALLTACADRNLDRIVRTLDTGQEFYDAADPASIVFYFVFELASGDVRSTLRAGHAIEAGRVLRTLHDVALGIQQLHGAEIAHQDLKPSNVLAFPGARSVSRIADLGRASSRATQMPHDALPGAGDRGYWTPEAMYSGQAPSWHERRGCDLYQLGSLLLFLFTGANATASWFSVIPESYRPIAFGGQYTGEFVDALPTLRDALQQTCDSFPSFGEDQLRDRLVRVFRELCEPDPALRGHPKDRGRDQYSVRRYVAEFDLEARRFDGRTLLRAA